VGSREGFAICSTASDRRNRIAPVTATRRDLRRTEKVIIPYMSPEPCCIDNPNCFTPK